MAADKLIEFKSITKEFGGTRALSDVSLDLRQGRDPRAARRERRRQVDADQDACRHLPAGWRQHPVSRRALSPSPAAAEPAPARRLHPPGSRPDRMDDRRRECRPRPGIFAALAASSTGARPKTRAREALKLVGCDFDPTTRVQDLTRTEKSLVAIARALGRRSRRAGARRADRQPARRRGRAAVRRHPPAQGSAASA